MLCGGFGHFTSHKLLPQWHFIDKITQQLFDEKGRGRDYIRELFYFAWLNQSEELWRLHRVLMQDY